MNHRINCKTNRQTQETSPPPQKKKLKDNIGEKLHHLGFEK